MSAGPVQEPAATPAQTAAALPLGVTEAPSGALLTFAATPDAVVSMQRTAGNVAVCRFLSQARGTVLARDAADDEIEKIEAEKLDIHALLARCRGLTSAQRDAMIAKTGAHASTTHEERIMASLLAAKLAPTMKRADFQNTYHELLARLPGDQRTAVLDFVGKPAVGKVVDPEGPGSGTVDKRSINDVGMRGAPGSSLRVNKILYVVVDGGVQFKTSESGGPAGLCNNPGNITVNDAHPAAWADDIGAYAGRSILGRFAIFPTYAAGRAGAKAWAVKQPSKTLLKYFQDYAPSSEPPNDPATYAQIVAGTINARLGSAKVTTSTTIEAILALGRATMDDFVSGQEKAEGFTQSNVKLVATDSADLPTEVRDFVAGFDAATGNTNAAADAVAVSP
jgi:hypothetical protein